ncbi:golgi-body localization protein domain-containing protein [Dipodascopsis uninucleata]
MQKPEGISLMLVELGALFCIIHLIAFVIFAVFRIVTGVSIHRLGYFSLRHITFCLKSGIQVDIRRMGLSFHRPAYSRPSWITLTVSDVIFYFDAIEDERTTYGSTPASPTSPMSDPLSERDPLNRANSSELIIFTISKAIQSVHKNLRYLNLIDFSMRNVSLVIDDIGTIQIRSIGVHTDDLTVELSKDSKIFSTTLNQANIKPGSDAVAVFRLYVKDIFYTHDKAQTEEILDSFQLDIYSAFDKSTLEYRDVAVNVQFGNIAIPFDIMQIVLERIKIRRKRPRRSSRQQDVPTKPDAGCGLDREEKLNIVQSVLHVFREVRFHIARINIYRVQPQFHTQEKKMYLSMGIKDFTIDVRRLSSTSPGHRLYFAVDDTSHQAIITAIAVTVGIHYEQTTVTDELLYVPMITMTSTTNFIRKSVEIFSNVESDRNASLLKGSLTITTPSVDIRARHLSAFAAFAKSYASSRGSSIPSTQRKGFRIGEILPKANLKLNIEEPAARIIVTDAELENYEVNRDNSSSNKDDIQNERVLASSCSVINCEIESSHLKQPSPHYALVGSLRISDFDMYVRRAHGARHEILHNETLLLKFIAETSPGLDVAIFGTLNTLDICLTRPEIIEGLKVLIVRFREEVTTISRRYSSFIKRKPKLESVDSNALTGIPAWISHIKLDGTDVTVSASSEDKVAMQKARGLAFQLGSWNIEYKPNFSRKHLSHHRRHRTIASGHESIHSQRSLDGKEDSNISTNRRRISIGLHDIEVCNINSRDDIEVLNPLMSVPNLEVALSTYSENGQPILDVSVILRRAIFNYSLYGHYCALLAAKALHRIFKRTSISHDAPVEQISTPPRIFNKPLLLIEFHSHNIRLKITLPDTPQMMLETSGLTYTRRGKVDVIRSHYCRLYVSSPTVPNAWERLVVVQNLRVELRKSLLESLNIDHEPEDEMIVDSKVISISIPYSLVFYHIIEGIKNTGKSLRQLHHQFKTDEDTYVLEPKSERPKKVPRIRIRPKVLEMRIDDDPFESRLGLIFRVGLIEMKSRIAREAAFEAKVQTLEKAANEKFFQKQSKGEGLSSFGEGLNGSNNASNSNLNDHTHNDGDKKHNGRSKRRHAFKAMKPKRKGAKNNRESNNTFRYSPTDAELPSESAKISREEAYQRLQILHSQSWIKRITHARRVRAEATEAKRERIVGIDLVDEDTIAHEKIIAVPDSPPLFQIIINDSDILIDKPQFPIEDTVTYIHETGKGVPLDTQYTLLIPMFLKFSMGEARFLLRDYPIPFIHIPRLASDQMPNMPSWVLSSNFVIAEEMKDESSVRKVEVPIIRAENDEKPGYFIVVPRTVTPVKMFSKINVEVNSSLPTRISYAPSTQPAVQQTMMIFDTFTKPPIDPSAKIGFWDKIRLIFHSKIRISWKNGSCHLLLKGSRDPYIITETGAGFAMCWRNNVVFDINPTGDQKEFMVVDSEQFILGIPDFNYYVKSGCTSADLMNVDDSISIASNDSQYAHKASFQKIIMKLSGQVRWKAGILFGRDTLEGQSFDFVPHYKVQLVNPKYVKDVKAHDSYAGFRSDYIHLALSVISPRDVNWKPFANNSSESSYNTVHLSPLAFMHFFDWWHLFSTAMSLPVRTGKLFTPQISKKFGRHLATIKYQFVIAPLFISHMYLHRRDEFDSKDSLNSVGFKGRTDSFMMDIHQCRETTTYMSRELNVKKKKRQMKINVAEIDFRVADIRGISLSFKDRTPNELFNQLNSAIQSDSESPTSSSNHASTFAKFKVSDNDLTWIDMDDYTELNSIAGTKNISSVKVLPLLYTPRFTYFRRTDKSNCSEISRDIEKWSPFGDEPSHNCLLGNIDTVVNQRYSILKRARELQEQIAATDELAEELVKLTELYTENQTLRQRLAAAKDDAKILAEKKHVLRNMWHALVGAQENIEGKDHNCILDEKIPHVSRDIFDDDTSSFAGSLNSIDMGEIDHLSDFNNRFIFHNVQIKWNNHIRNIFMKYIYQVGQRRGSVYYMSRRAVKFIEDLVKDQKAGRNHTTSGVMDESSASGGRASHTSNEDNDENGNGAPIARTSTEALIETLLKDSKSSFIVKDEKSNNRDGHIFPPLKEEDEEGESTCDKDDISSNNLPEIARRVDRLSVDFPKFVADFSDLSEAPEMVEELQQEIRQLEEIKNQFLIYSSEIDEQGWRDFRNANMELNNAKEELFFLMKAITKAQHYHEEKEAETTGILQWFISGKEIIAHMLLEDRTPFVDVALANGIFRRMENSDGSNINCIEIDMLQAVNLLKEAIYPELLSPYFKGMPADNNRRKKAVRVYWYMLEAIGGIPVMDHFEVDLIPMKIQLEYDIGQKIFDYVFPDHKQSPFMLNQKRNAHENNDKNDDSGVLSSSDSSSDDDDDGDSEIALSSLGSNNSVVSISQPKHSSSWPSRLRRARTSSNASNGPNLSQLTARDLSVGSAGSNHHGSGDMYMKLSDNASVNSLQSGNSETTRSNTFLRHADSFGIYGTQTQESDISQMVMRASNYITFVNITIHSVILCISYKGKGSRNLEDVHEFEFRLPNIEYRNRTWSNLDLALRLKKDIIKALISHTGALIENKFKKRNFTRSRKKRASRPEIRQISDYADFTSLADLSSSSIAPRDNEKNH